MKCSRKIFALIFFVCLSTSHDASSSGANPAPIRLLLMTHKYKGEVFHSSAVYSKHKIFTAAHSIKNCPAPCKSFELAVYDKEKEKLISVGQIDRKQFKFDSKSDIAVARSSQISVPSETFSDSVSRCLSFSMLPEKQSIVTRLKNNETINTFDIPRRGLGNLIAMYSREGAVESPGPLDGGPLEIENTQSSKAVYSKTGHSGLYYVETSFPPRAQFAKADSVIRVPCAGWFGSSGGAFVQGSILGIISGPATKFVASIRQYLDYGDLNVSIVEL